MKKTILFLLLGTAAFAQTVDVRRNLTGPGAVLGAVAGAVIGNNSGHGNGAQGAVIGAAAGAILGNAAENAQSGPPPRYYSRPGYNRSGDPVATGAFFGGIAGGIIGNNSGHGNGGRGALIGAGIGAVLGSSVADNSYYYQPAPAVRYYARPARDDNPVVSGALFGGLAGAIIGNNGGRGNGGRGALIGAGIGALLGAVSEPRYAPRPEAPRYYEPPHSYVQQANAPQPTTVINNYYVSVSPSSGGYRMDAPADGR